MTIEKYENIMSSITGTVIDEGISMIPGVNILWALAKAGVEKSNNLKVIRLVEFLGGISEADAKYIGKIGSSEQAITGLGICIDYVVKARTDNKRKIIKDIYLDFLDLDDEEREKFDLERLLDINSKITYYEILLLKKINNGKSNMSNASVNNLLLDGKGPNETNDIDIYQIFKQLEGLGLITIKNYTYNPEKYNASLSVGGNNFSIFFTYLGDLYINYLID